MARMGLRLTELLVVASAGCGRIGFAPGAGDDADDTDDGPPTVFTKVTLPAGGSSTDVAVSAANPDVVYGIASGRVFRSPDRGASWVDCNFVGWAEELQPSPTNENVVYVIDVGDGLFTSTDCATWSPLADFAETTALLVLDDDDILVGAQGIVRYRNGVATPIPSPFDGAYIEAFATNGTTLLVTTYGRGIGRSTDGGTTFVPANTGLPPTIEAQGVVFPDPQAPALALVQTYLGTYHSVDEGQSWTTSAGGGDGRGPIAASPVDPSFVVASIWYGARRSTDGGISFDAGNIRSASMESSYLHDLAFAPNGRLYTASGRGFFTADDTVPTWTPANSGLDAWSILDLDRDPVQGTLFAATSAGVLRSEDDGATWSPHSAGMETFDSQLTFVHAIRDQAGAVFAGGGSRLWFSGDYGDTFGADGTVDADDSDGWVANVMTTSASAGWIGTGTRLWHTEDEGESWAQHQIAGDQRFVHDVAITQTAGVWVATRTGLFRTLDGGDSFEPLPIVEASTEAYALLDDAGTIATGTADGVHVWTGASWSPAGLAGREIYDLELHADSWIAAADDGVYWSNDRGATWTELVGLREKQAFTLLVDPQGTLFVGTRGYGMFRTQLP